MHDHCRGPSKAKHLQTSQAIWDEINLISLRAEKLAAESPVKRHGLYDHNSIQGGSGAWRSEIGVFKVAANLVVTSNRFPSCG